ncbi:MAG TPA: YraN family protein [Nostocaceae cyanobacterium]|nr:YraN family protein [Nostocaceae cyanobacterium]
MPNPVTSNYPDIGDSGEDLVAQWLQSTGWEILHRRFRCRWGELDIVAEYHERTKPHQPPTLAFVEVKTRSTGSWDQGGREAITTKKQTKLWRTAEIFLTKYPDKANYLCRFDVAIVSCQRILHQVHGETVNQKCLASLSISGYRLELEEYIPAAFDYSVV